jgi:hypothetical protein
MLASRSNPRLFNRYWRSANNESERNRAFMFMSETAGFNNYNSVEVRPFNMRMSHLSAFHNWSSFDDVKHCDGTPRHQNPPRVFRDLTCQTNKLMNNKRREMTLPIIDILCQASQGR